MKKTKEYQACNEVEQAHICVPLSFPLFKSLMLVPTPIYKRNNNVRSLKK